MNKKKKKVVTNMADSVSVDKMTPLFSKASVKSALRMVVASGTTLAVKEKKEEGDFEFGSTPGGFALLKGEYELPGWTAGTCTAKAPTGKAPKPKKSGGKKGGKVAGKGKVDWVLDFGANPDGSKENPTMTKTCTLETGIPERAWCKVNIKPATVKGVYSGGLDKKGREIVFVLDRRFIDEFTMEVSCKRRVYSNSSSQIFNWESDLKVLCVVVVPKPQKEESDDDDDADAGALLGGSDSSSSDDSDSDSDS